MAIKIEGYTQFLKTLGKLRSMTNNLSPLFYEIAQEFSKIQKNVVFRGGSASGPGKYSDLKSNTKVHKQRQYGRVYPVLVANGRLMDSFEIGNQDNITEIMPLSLKVGTKTPYAGYIHFGTRTAPKRPVIIPELLINRLNRLGSSYLDQVVKSSV